MANKQYHKLELMIINICYYCLLGTNSNINVLRVGNFVSKKSCSSISNIYQTIYWVGNLSHIDGNFYTRQYESPGWISFVFKKVVEAYKIYISLLYWVDKRCVICG